MKNEIKAFFIGFISGIAAIIAFILGRKSNLFNAGGIRSDNIEHDAGAERIDSIEGRIESASGNIDSAIGILEAAKKRSEKQK